MGDFLAQVGTGVEHIKRLGGNPRPLQSLVGQHPLTVLVAIGHADLDEWGAYSDAAAGDAQLQEFWGGVMADPTAELVRSGVYLNVS